MKYIIQIFAVIAVIALLTSCSNASKGTEKNTSADAPAGAATEVYIDVTDAPTEVTPSESATSKDINDKTPAGAGEEEEEKTSADAPTGDKSELTADRWSLTAVYRDGEQKSISVQYGSVIRETGAYIRFNEDDTFECVLGIPGCKGTYAVENGDVVLHITTKYGAKTEECDEYETVRWDHSADTLTFDLNDYTNVFTKGG